MRADANCGTQGEADSLPGQHLADIVRLDQPAAGKLAQHPDTRLFWPSSSPRTIFATLNRTLQRLHGHKDKVLLVLRRIWSRAETVAKATCASKVKWRKISGGTRRDLGNAGAMASLVKENCQKLGISFQDYLRDRIGRHDNIPHCPISFASASQRQAPCSDLVRSH